MTKKKEALKKEKSGLLKENVDPQPNEREMLEEALRRKRKQDDVKIQQRLHDLRREIRKKTTEKVLPYPFIGRNMLFVESFPGSRAKLSFKSDGRFMLTLKSFKGGHVVDVEGIEGMMRAEPKEEVDPNGNDQSLGADVVLEPVLTYKMEGKQYSSAEAVSSSSSSKKLEFNCRIMPFARPKVVEVECLRGLPKDHDLFRCSLPCVECDPLPQIGGMPPIRKAAAPIGRRMSLPNLPTYQTLPPPGTVVRRGELLPPRELSKCSKVEKLEPLVPQKNFDKLEALPSQSFRVKVDMEEEVESMDCSVVICDATVAVTQHVDNIVTRSPKKTNLRHALTEEKPINRSLNENLDTTDKDRYWMPETKKMPPKSSNDWNDYYKQRSQMFLQRVCGQ